MKPILEGFQDLNFDSIINESTKKKSWVISGITLKAEQKNVNGRIYPKQILASAINEHMKSMPRNRCLGELKHPDDGNMNINLDRVSHKFIDVQESGNNYFVKAKVLNTECGKKVQALLEEGIELGMSSRAVGNLDHKADAIYVTKLHILSFGDIVHNPSCPGAFLDGIFENQDWIYMNGIVKEKQIDEYKQIIESATRQEKNEAMLKAFKKYFKDLLGV